MMSEDKQNLKVIIADREFTIACTEEESEGVLAAASYLNQQMKLVEKSSNTLGTDRLAIMTALNISHDLLEVRKDIGEGSAVDTRLDQLNEKIDSAMDKIRQVTI